jgi:hypothetical protein
VLWQENHGFSRESPYFLGKSVIFGSLRGKNKEFEEFKELQEFKERSQEPRGARVGVRVGRNKHFVPKSNQ